MKTTYYDALFMYWNHLNVSGLTIHDTNINVIFFNKL